MRNILPAIRTCVLLLPAMPAGGYEILLDIDTDDDPTTINDLTYENEAVVRSVLAPAEPVIDYFVLTEPIFIATFNTWVADPVPPGCQQPASNLAAMFDQGENGFWNYVQLGGPAVSRSWGGVKAPFR